MPVRLFVGNLPYDATEAELREHFSAAGRVSYLSLPTDRESGQLRGFAFVEFSDTAQAEEAIRRFHNQNFKGRPIAVSIARPREDRPPGSASSRPPAPRSGTPRLTLNAQPDVARPSAPVGRPSRDFGPDASPETQRNKKKPGPRPERAPKGPMREMVRGQFFGGDDDADDFDDDVDDFYEDADDLYKDSDEFHNEEPKEESTNESLAGLQNNLKGEDNQ
jgi:RNA recognition motif-containing protein